MQAVILAAGIGNRLGVYADNKPKSLLEFGGKSLLQRHADNLLAIGIDNIYIVTGYQADMITSHLQNYPATIQFIYNPRYKEGSLVSLSCAKDVLVNGGEFLIMDADVLYDKQILTQLLNTKNKNCLLVDMGFVYGDEPVKVCIDSRGRIIEFRKRLSPELEFAKRGESVGFFRFDSHVGKRLMSRIEHYMAEAEYDTAYEEAIRDCLLTTPELFGYEDITGLAWIEIDFPEDMVLAREEILPNI